MATVNWFLYEKVFISPHVRTMLPEFGCVLDSLNLPITVEEYIEQMRSMQEEVFPSCALMPGYIAAMLTRIIFCRYYRRRKTYSSLA